VLGGKRIGVLAPVLVGQVTLGRNLCPKCCDLPLELVDRLLMFETEVVQSLPQRGDLDRGEIGLADAGGDGFDRSQVAPLVDGQSQRGRARRILTPAGLLTEPGVQITHGAVDPGLLQILYGELMVAETLSGNRGSVAANGCGSPGVEFVV